MFDCQTDMEFVYVVTTSTETYVAAVGEELPCEYEARNVKDII